VTDPQGPAAGSIRVIRGGSWFIDARYCRSAHRGRNAPGSRFGDLGLRLLRTDP
jgi:formylglycine-generating enzyme